MVSADDLGDALLTCSSVYVASAAIGFFFASVRLSLRVEFRVGAAV